MGVPPMRLVVHVSTPYEAGCTCEYSITLLPHWMEGGGTNSWRRGHDFDDIEVPFRHTDLLYKVNPFSQVKF